MWKLVAETLILISGFVRGMAVSKNKGPHVESPYNKGHSIFGPPNIFMHEGRFRDLRCCHLGFGGSLLRHVVGII